MFNYGMPETRNALHLALRPDNDERATRTWRTRCSTSLAHNRRSSKNKGLNGERGEKAYTGRSEIKSPIIPTSTAAKPPAARSKLTSGINLRKARHLRNGHTRCFPSPSHGPLVPMLCVCVVATCYCNVVIQTLLGADVVVSKPL